MPRKLYSLIVGIADYQEASKLEGCLIDVDNITKYVRDLQKEMPKAYDAIIDPIVLIDESATRDHILDHLTKVVMKLEDMDTLLFYYCGHGVNEKSQDQFFGNYNDTIQSLYCYDAADNNTLASKEIRYVLHQAPEEAHILALYDCCHSGEMSRSSKPKVQRRSASSSPKSARSFENFTFSNETTEEELRSKDFNEIFPDRNIISLGACLPREEAFGNDYGGFFTSSLLRILEANKNIINYADLLKQIDLDIRRTDQYKQAPAISIIGDRRYDQSTSWLRINGDHLESGQSFIKFNENTGWIFSQGLMHGLEEGNSISIELSDNETVDVDLKTVNLIDSLIDDDSIKNFELDREMNYKVVRTDINKAKPVLAINNVDGETEIFEQLVSILKDNDQIKYSKDLNEADYHVNLFNGLVYFSFPYLTYQPLNTQFETSVDLEDLNGLKSYLRNDLTTLTNWFHFKNLEIKGGFPEIPIKVEIKTDHGEYIDITNGKIELNTKGRTKKSLLLFRSHDLKITNTTSTTIHVTLLALYNSRHAIDTHDFKDETVDIDPGKSKEILNYYLVLDNYQEIYNWEFEEVSLKFLVNNYGKITQDISSMTQDGFSTPMILETAARGGGREEEIEEELENPFKNALYTSQILLKNNKVDKVTGELEEQLETYLKHEKIGPFIKRLYSERVLIERQKARH